MLGSLRTAYGISLAKLECHLAPFGSKTHSSPRFDRQILSNDKARFANRFFREVNRSKNKRAETHVKV